MTTLVKRISIIIIAVCMMCVFMPSMVFAGSNALPTKYDLRNVNGISYVTPVKMQGDCWAFATIGALESAAIKSGLANGDVDYSEAYLEYFTYHGYINDENSPMYGDGVNYVKPFNGVGTGALQDYIGLITSRAGIVDESKYPFILNEDGVMDTTCQDKMKQYFEGKPELRFLKNNIEIKRITQVIGKSTATKTKRNAVKKALIKNGNADVEFCFGDDANIVNIDDHSSYYYNKDGSEYHVVDIVGWDDNYAVKYFGKNKPPHKGAWLCKNSWGFSIIRY